MPWAAILFGFGVFFMMTMTNPWMWLRRGLKIYLYSAWYWTWLVLGAEYVV